MLLVRKEWLFFIRENSHMPTSSRSTTVRKYLARLVGGMEANQAVGIQNLVDWIPGPDPRCGQRVRQSSNGPGPLGTADSAVSNEPPSSHAPHMQKRRRLAAVLRAWGWR